MNFTCTQENLHKGLLKVQGTAGQTSTLPILKNVLLEVKNGSLKLKTTNLEIGATTQIRGKAQEEGAITVDAKILSNFVALLPQDKVVLMSKGKGLAIEGGLHKTKINALSAEDFPVIPEVSHHKGFKLKAKELKNGLSQILPAVSLDDTRPEINGVCFGVKKELLTLVGTDSYRLSEKKVQLIDNFDTKKSKSSFQGTFIIPFRTIKELVRIIDEEDDLVEVYISDNQVLFVCGSTEMVSRLVEGEFPDYQQIIPTSFNVKFSLSKEDFIKAVKISGLFAEIGSNSVTLELKPPTRQLTIFSATSLGEERTDLKLDIEGEVDLKIVFDYRYLLDALNSIEDAEVIFSATGESSPVLLKPQNEQEAFLCVVMPIRQ